MNIQHTDLVRQLLPFLHFAAEQHRQVNEHINATSPNDAALAGKQLAYTVKVMIVRQAIDALLREQDDLAASFDSVMEDHAIQDLLK